MDTPTLCKLLNPTLARYLIVTSRHSGLRRPTPLVLPLSVIITINLVDKQRLVLPPLRSAITALGNAINMSPSLLRALIALARVVVAGPFPLVQRR